jgi:hypothetical protein
VASFNPETTLERAVHAGDADATLTLLRATEPQQRAKQGAAIRRMAKLIYAARWSSSPTEWGSRPTDGQLRSLAMAVTLCGTAQDVAEAWVEDDLLLALCKEFKPRSLEGLADALLARRPHLIRTVTQLIAAGLATRPDNEAYTLGLIAIPQAVSHEADLNTLFAADPGLRPALMRVFDIEGTGDVCLASSDKYNRCPWSNWNTLLLKLADDGITTRSELLNRTLSALANDWPQHRSGWFSRFHAELAPSPLDMTSHLPRYLAMCASRIAPTVTMALDALRQIDTATPIAADALLDALRPVMASTVKAQLAAAIKLLDRAVAREPQAASRASDVVALALLHEAAPLQALVLTRLARWGMSAALRSQLPEFTAAIAASNRVALQSLCGGAPSAVSTKAEPPAPALTLANKAPEPTDEDRRLAPITDLHELVDCIAHVFEHAEDVDEFERAIAGLVMAAPIAEAKALFAPVLKRASRMQHPLPRELARLLRCVLTGEQSAGYAGVDAGGNPCPVDKVLIERMDELMLMAKAAHKLAPLATPTHRGGFIAAEQLVERWQAHVAAGAAPTEPEQVRALMRLAPGSGHAALAPARALADHAFTRALRYALGDDIAPGNERALFAAAARIRHPGADDLALDALHPNLGPDGALAARYAWHPETRSHEFGGKTYIHHDFMIEVSPKSATFPAGLLAVQRHGSVDAARRHFRWWRFAGSDAGTIRYAAALLPSDPQAFFAEGARAIGNNLDWAEAQWQNRAYLEPLLDPVTPMSPMAQLLLLLAMAGKEPGQTAVAVDALVQAFGDGRLSEHQALAAMLRELLASPLLKVARLHKSFKAALRAEPRIADLVFDLLGAAVQARPQDPPRDMTLLLDLLLALRLEGRRELPPAVREAVASMKLTGNGRALQKKLMLTL